MNAPIPNTPARLHGSFNSGLHQPTAQQVVDEFIRRVELTTDSSQRGMQAQRAIGALMALTAFNADRAGNAFFHKDVFARLAQLTGTNPNELVTCAGVAR